VSETVGRPPNLCSAPQTVSPALRGAGRAVPPNLVCGEKANCSPILALLDYSFEQG
jgi:hypothetical protein